MKEAPPAWKNRERYMLEDAIWLWAYVFYDAPREAKATTEGRWTYSREYALAREALADIPPEREEWTETPRQIRFGGSWKGDWPVTPPPDPVTKVRYWVSGRDLAQAAAEHGAPGAFGFKRTAGGHRDQQIARIKEVAAELNVDWRSPPHGYVKRIKEECLKDRKLFTADGFDHAWKALKKRGA